GFVQLRWCGTYPDLCRAVSVAVPFSSEGIYLHREELGAPRRGRQIDRSIRERDSTRGYPHPRAAGKKGRGIFGRCAAFILTYLSIWTYFKNLRRSRNLRELFYSARQHCCLTIMPL